MNDGGPAFPQSCDDFGASADDEVKQGMSLRDWFAGQALIGLMSNPAGVRHKRTELAEFAYQAADSMLAERER